MNNNNLENLSSLSKRFKYILGILVITLVVAAVGVLVFYSKNRGETPQQNFLTTRDTGLTDLEKANYQKQIQELQNQLKPWLSKDDKFKIYATLGQDYYMIGQLIDAKTNNLKASELKPDAAVIWEQLYLTARAMTDYKAAEQYIQKALALAPENQGYKQELEEIKQLLAIPR